MHEVCICKAVTIGLVCVPYWVFVLHCNSTLAYCGCHLNNNIIILCQRYKAIQAVYNVSTHQWTSIHTNVIQFEGVCQVPLQHICQAYSAHASKVTTTVSQDIHVYCHNAGQKPVYGTHTSPILLPPCIYTFHA